MSEENEIEQLMTKRPQLYTNVKKFITKMRQNSNFFDKFKFIEQQSLDVINDAVNFHQVEEKEFPKSKILSYKMQLLKQKVFKIVH